ncbi:hypothetical protein ACXYTJ_07970 [Gilvimarinus sp. F26214L]|uniref:hypothetical protein n=1 Tax=Gilvimarinus sp. DZF01 TaxID=3461371 RepID=UPI0040466171
MTPTEKFVHAPLVFLERNIIITPSEVSNPDELQSQPLFGDTTRSFSYKDGVDGVFHLGLEKLERVRGSGRLVRGMRNGAPCPVYELVRKQPGDKDSFKAYWCPYRERNAGGVVIRNKADMMFTITLNGCSLGVGHKANNGARLITHANMGANAQTQRIMIRAQGDFGKQVIEPDNYRDRQNNGRLVGNATVFGRINPITRDWIFHALKYDCSTSFDGDNNGTRTYTHNGLVDLLEARV